MNFKIYLMGELIQNPVDNPIIRPSMNSVKMTYTLARFFPSFCFFKINRTNLLPLSKTGAFYMTI